MTAGQINKELATLRELDGALTDEFIAAGRGHERPSDYLDPKRTDPLSARAQAISRRIGALRVEVELRAGPGFHELPYSRDRRSFGPRTKSNPPRSARRTRRNSYRYDVAAVLNILPDKLAAVKYLRGVGMPFESARSMVHEIDANREFFTDRWRHAKWVRERLHSYKINPAMKKSHARRNPAAAIKNRHFITIGYIGPTRANPRSRPVSATVSYREGGRQWFAVRDGNRIGWSTSHAMATPLSLREARGLKAILARRRINADVRQV